MTFREWCKSNGCTAAEKQELMWYLAFLRLKNTIRMLCQ